MFGIREIVLEVIYTFLLNVVGEQSMSYMYLTWYYVIVQLVP